MVRKLLLPSGSRRWITPIVMLLLLLGIIAGAFIVSSVTQRHVQLDDGTVWITSLKDRQGRTIQCEEQGCGRRSLIRSLPFRRGTA